MSDQETKSTEIESEVLLEKSVKSNWRNKKPKVPRRKPQRDNTAEILNEKRELSEPLSDEEAKRQMSQRSRRGFLIGGATALAGIFGWRWLPDETKQNLFRRAFEFNEKSVKSFTARNDSRRNFHANLPERGSTEWKV
jgi:hypothetical protein